MLVRAHRYSKILGAGAAPWLRPECAGGGTDLDGIFGANCTAGYSQHEGAYFDAADAVAFADFLREPASACETREERAAALRTVGGSHPGEEVLLQTYVLTRRARDDGAALARPPGPAFCAHWPPRKRRVGLEHALSYRLGVNTSLPRLPLQIKRWDDRPGDERVLACFASRDAKIAAGAASAARVVAVQANTVACLDAHAYEPRGPLAGLAPGARRARALLGDADTFPDYAAVVAQVRAWVRSQPPS